MERWNNTCNLFYEQKKKNVSEKEFQFFIENLFIELGWSKLSKEILSREPIPIGSGGSLIPDILIKGEGRNSFVVELKKPSATPSDKHEEQLSSYMLQRQLSFGLFIGEVIHVLFNNPNDKRPPRRVLTIEFTPDNLDGKELLEIISKKGYSENAAVTYCEKKLKQLNENDTVNKIIDELTAVDSTDPIIESLLGNLGKQVKQKYTVSDKIAEKVKIGIKIQIMDKRGSSITSIESTSPKKAPGKKPEIKKPSAPISKTEELRLLFWTKLLDRFSSVSDSYSKVSASKDHWLYSGSGVSGVNFAFIATNSYAGLELNLARKEKEENKRMFDTLFEMKDEIEREYGFQVEWERLDDKIASRLASRLRGVSIQNAEEWPKMMDFLCDRMPKWDRALRERIKLVKP